MVAAKDVRTERERGLLVVLEGLPGSGKTSVARLMISYGWKFYPEVATTLAEKGVPVGDAGTTETDLQIFKEEIRRLREVRHDLAKGIDVLLDGYFPTDLSFAYARSQQGKSRCYVDLLEKYLQATRKGLLLKPDLYVYLDINADVSVSRQQERHAPHLKTIDRKTLGDVERHMRFMHEIFENDVPLVTVDGTRSSGEVFQDVAHQVKKLARKNPSQP